MKKLFVLILMFAAVNAYGQKFEGLAKTPPMGWNSWNHFGCNVSEDLIKGIADAMVESGMKDAGYEYVVIDDCWHGERDENGFIQEHPERFPSGMKALAGYIHSLGLKFGIYSSAGFQTCAGYPASRGYEFQDALQYARWGVDYLKYDWCGTEGLNAKGAYMTMRDALYAAGRPIVLSICEWGDNDPWGWAHDVGHLWRTTGDIHLCWDCEYDHGAWSAWGFLKILDMHDPLRKYNGPDHWNDADMLQVGNGMEVNMDRAHFIRDLWLKDDIGTTNDVKKISVPANDVVVYRLSK